MTSATPRAARAVLVAAALVLTGACDNGGAASEETPPAAGGSSGSASASTSSAAPTVAPSPTPSGTAPEDPDGAEQDIREAWRVFFDPKSSVDDRSEVVENGHENALMIDNLFRDPLGSRLRAEVTSVAFTSDLNADVAYTLTRDGRRLDTGGQGAAVLHDDDWRIALRTVCALTRHAKDAPEAPGCG